MDSIKLWESLSRRSPPEIIDDKSLHSCRNSGIDEGFLQCYTARAYDADHCILICECFGEVGEGVVDAESGDGGWVDCCRKCSGYYRYIEVCVDQGGSYGSAEVA